MRLLLISHDNIGERMAGPGIRYWELAHALAGNHEVTLLAPEIALTSERVRLRPYSRAAVRELAKQSDVAVTQALPPLLLAALRSTDVRIVLDAYDPVILESLHNDRSLRPAHYRAMWGAHSATSALSLLNADAVVCASDRQRDLWLGSLMSLRRLTPAAYARDPSFSSLVGVVPFGLPDEPPRHLPDGPRERFRFDAEDVVALWGGGLWDWFDPVTVIKGLAAAREANPQLRLVFMGTQRPSQSPLGAGHAIRAALETVQRTGQDKSGVFFADEWIPYHRRQAWLTDADIGVSCHFDHVETRFSFRTRVLDYLWAGLPCILTEGDSLADLAATTGFGITPSVGDVAGWATAFARLTDAGTRSTLGTAATRQGRSFTWERAAEALALIAQAAADAPARRPPVSTAAEALAYLRNAVVASAHQGRVKSLLGPMAPR